MGSVFGKRTVEEPKHKVIYTAPAEGTESAFELREYPARWAIATHNDRKAFMKLAGYIGVGSKPKNAGAAPIAMTAPVTNTPAKKPKGTAIAMTAPVVNDEGGDMMFILPSEYGEDSEPPAPLNDEVRTLLLPREYIAVVTFSGSVDMEATEDTRCIAKRDALVHDAVTVGLLPEGAQPSEYAFDVHRYNPPWTLPPFRTNEVAVKIAPEMVQKFKDTLKTQV